MEMNVFMQEITDKTESMLYRDKMVPVGPIYFSGESYPSSWKWNSTYVGLSDGDSQWSGFSFCAFQVKIGMVIFLHGSHLLPSEMMISKEMVQRLYNG